MLTIPQYELELRCAKVSASMLAAGCTALLLRSVPNHLYLTGSVFSGYIYLKAGELPLFFPDKPTPLLHGCDCVYPIRKPEQIPALLTEKGCALDSSTAVERSVLSHAEYERLEALTPEHRLSPIDAAALMREVRSVKTPYEIEEIRRAVQPHMEIYRLIPSLYEEGMTDADLQHRIEYEMRRRGSIGVFRCFGTHMEIFMGNITVGSNANTPAPYDFTMGGAGTPGLPIGASGLPIAPNVPIMIDVAGNYGPYNTDITRVYSRGEVAPELARAHALSIEMHRYFERTARVGLPLAEIYNGCVSMAGAAGLADHFMGQDHQVKFVGHGVGIEINEPPVMTPRWKGTIAEGMLLAFEPKFVFADQGAVGIENTYLVTADGVENLTPLPEEIIPLHS